MIKDIILLGSTGSIGESTLNIIHKNKKNYKIKLLTTNKNIQKIYRQALKFKVKKVVIFDKKNFYRHSSKFKKRKIKVFFTVKNALKDENKKIHFAISAISGIDGLEPTINVIKHVKNLGIANKESIICGWKFIKKELKKNKTNFVPLDSEHFSIWSLLRSENKKNINKIYLTASGGPFLFKKLSDIKNIKPKDALKHPNWKMGKKISIDSATMMNKIFEVIEAKKIFDLNIEHFDILIHPKSYIHAIIHLKNGLTKFLAHDTTMEVPIINFLNINNEHFTYKSNFKYLSLNGINFIKPDLKNFPLLKIINYEIKNTYFEIILVTLNDSLVNLYLQNSISYFSVHKLLMKLLKKPYFTKFYDKGPKNINEIKNMVDKVKKYIDINSKINFK